MRGRVSPIGNRGVRGSVKGTVLLTLDRIKNAGVGSVEGVRRTVPLTLPTPLRRAWRRLPHRPRAFARRLVDDRHHRAFVGTGASLVVDTLWGCGNLAYGFWAASPWFGALGAYYLLLALMRVVLIRDIRRSDAARTASAMRLCGGLVAALACAPAAFVLLTSTKLGGFTCPDIVIYAVATYAFFALGTAIAGSVSNHRHGRQSLFAVSCVNLANALVSILALEIAMMSLFGAGEDPETVLLMNALTGAGVGVADIVLGALLIRRAGRLGK